MVVQRHVSGGVSGGDDEPERAASLPHLLAFVQQLNVLGMLVSAHAVL
jgi:hypothetical protein